MGEPRNWDMLARYLANEVTPEEATEIQAWIDSDPENQIMVQKLKASFSIADTEEASDLNVLWNEISREIGRSKYGIAHTPSRLGLFEWLRRAVAARPILVPAAVMGMLFALGWIPYHFIWDSPAMLTVAVPFGERKTVDLQDGTHVVLDAGSQIQYPEHFADDSRHIRLQGAGYFQVTRDATRPFVVTASDGEIEVLGTAFDVQCWDETPVVVSVEEGRVKFGRLRSAADQSVVLVANQSSELSADAGPTPPITIDVSRRLAWMRDEVFYDDTRLADILDRLHRWHTFNFTVSDPTLLDERLTVHLFKSDLQGSADLLAQLLGLEVVRDATTIRLTRSKSRSH